MKWHVLSIVAAAVTLLPATEPVRAGAMQATGTFSFAVGTAAPAGPYWAGGHGDVDLHEASPGDWEIHYHFHAGSLAGGPTGGDGFPGAPSEEPPAFPAYAWAWEADAVTLWVNTGIPGVALSRPAGGQWDFTGVAAGETLYVLPATPTSGLPYLGFSAEEQPLDVVYTLGAVTAGQISAFAVGGFGSPIPYWSSASPLSTVSANGLTIPAGSHAHVFLGFSQPGAFTAVITAVPEPATACMAAAGGTALAAVFGRRRGRGAVTSIRDRRASRGR